MTTMLRGYRTIWMATLLFFGGFYALLVPLPRYLAAVGLVDWQIGIVLGTFGVASLVGRPAAGVAVDRMGARPVLLAGAAALVIGALGMLTTTAMALLLLFRLLQAVGYVAFTTAGTALVVVLIPPAQRAQRLAVFGIAANVAITLTPAAMSVLLEVLPLASGFVLAGSLALFAGLLAVGAPVVAPAAALTVADPWRTPSALWLPMLLSGLFGAGFAAFFQFAPILAARRGDLAGGSLYTVYGIGIIATRLGSGRVLAGIPAGHLLRGAAISMLLGLGMLAATPPVALLGLAVLLIAAGSGISHPTLIAYHAALLPQAPGRAMAAFYIGFDLGIGLGSWVCGGLLQVYGLSGLYTGAALLVALVVPLASRLKPQA
jgi:predicted MFS family arabinose efflux permease